MAILPPPGAIAQAYRPARAIGAAMVLSLAIFAVVVEQIQRANAPFDGFVRDAPRNLLRPVFTALALTDLWLVRVMRAKILAKAAVPPSLGLLGVATDRSG